MIFHFIDILRPSHYLKNTLVLAPLFFAPAIFDTSKLSMALIAFLSCCLCASAVYIFNDYCDIESDRLHPEKRNRALANNLISTSSALLLMTALLFAGLGLLLLVSPKASLVLLTYCLINIFYCLKGKHIVGLDVSLIALGFVLRLYVGAYTTDIILSDWLISLTFSSALFLALAKRRNERLIFQNTGMAIRSKIASYHLQSLNIAIIICALAMLVLYIAYTYYSPNSPNLFLYLSSFLVAAGLLRYLKIIFLDNGGGSPIQLILTDRYLQILITLWLAGFSWILYQ